MSDTSRPAAERLRHAIDQRVRAEAAEARALADFAAEHEWPVDAEVDLIGQRPARIGADGTPVLDEFVALEVAALKGISVSAATWLIRDVVNLRFRHPRLWARTLAGALPLYRACQLAAEAVRFELTLQQAHAVDDELAAHIGRLPWRRLLAFYRGLIADQVPGRLSELADRARADRYVRKLPTDEPLVSYLSARVDTADAIHFDAMVDRIADLLETHGDTDTKDVRRAKSIGILATPARATLLLAEGAGPTATRGRGPMSAAGFVQTEPDQPTLDQPTSDSALAAVWQSARAALPRLRWTDPRLLPKSRVYVHVAEDTVLHGRGPARAENIGPIAAAMLALLVGHTRVQLTPVIRPYEDIVVDSYEIPQRIHDQVIMRDSCEVFPFSSRPARTAQHDHTKPYRSGVLGQTHAANLGALSVKVHRAKTHGRWRLKQPKPGIFWWTSPAGNRYRVGPGGSMPMTTDTPLERAVTDAILRHDQSQSHSDAGDPPTHPGTGRRRPRAARGGPRWLSSAKPLAKTGLDKLDQRKSRKQGWKRPRRR